MSGFHKALMDKGVTTMSLFGRPLWLMTGLVFVFAAGLLPGQAYAAGMFGFTEIRANRIASIPKWVALLARARPEVARLKACVDDAQFCDGPAAVDWAKFIRETRGKSRQAQVFAVNRYMNQWRYITDERLHGVRDLWATPLEFMTQSGDCEDYAIAKYYALKTLGWADADLRLVIVQDTVRGIPHAVLSAKVRDGGDTGHMILDNLLPEPLSDKYLMQYTPYYAVNETTRWTFIKPMR